MNDGTPVGDMTEQQAKAELARLAELLNRANTAYHQDDSPEIPDADYDAFKIRNAEIEDRFPDLKRSDSPSEQVGAALLAHTQNLPTHPHHTPHSSPESSNLVTANLPTSARLHNSQSKALTTPTSAISAYLHYKSKPWPSPHLRCKFNITRHNLAYTNIAQR